VNKNKKVINTANPLINQSYKITNKIFVNAPGTTTMVAVAINTGAYYEELKYKGISHFLEHMCFKGNPKRNQKQISSAIDNVGGILNAFTDWETTTYWALVGNTYKDLAIDVITDLATKPLIPAKEVDKERHVILQEMKMYKDEPNEDIWNLFYKNISHFKSGFKINIIGNEQTLARITRKRLLEYHEKYYSNPTLIVVGNIEENLQSPINSKNLIIPENYSHSKKRYELIERKNITQSHVIIGNMIESPYEDKLKTTYLMYILKSIYNDMSGRLFSEIREKYNLVYGIHFDFELYRNNTLQWTVSLGLDKNKIDKAYKLILEQLNKPISKQELEIAVNKLFGRQELFLSQNENIGRRIAYSLATNKDWYHELYGYKTLINCIKNQTPGMIKKINFKDNVLAGIIPKNRG
jgi:predicted Zn-dependent peptidase